MNFAPFFGLKHFLSHDKTSNLAPSFSKKEAKITLGTLTNL